MKALENGFKLEDAYYELAKKSKKITIENMDVLFYPYLLIEYEIDYGPKLSRLNTNVLCLVDTARDEYNIAKSRGSYVTVDAEEATMMPRTVDRKYAIKEGPKRIYGEILNSRKVIITPDITYLNDEEIYKAFYVVECKNDIDEYFHILYDAVSGKFTLLNG